jgi:phage/plasmid-associated DNA primase
LQIFFKKTDKKNLRFGIKEIYTIYEKWCRINGNEMIVKKLFLKKELELLNYTEEKGKGINNISGKRCYNILLSL